MDRYERREEIKELIEYEILRKEYPYDEIDSILELILDVVNSTAPTIRIGGDAIPTEAVKDRFWQLDHSHIEYVMDAMKKTTTQIHNIRAYLLTALYNAPVTIALTIPPPCGMALVCFPLPARRTRLLTMARHLAPLPPLPLALSKMIRARPPMRGRNPAPPPSVWRKSKSLSSPHCSRRTG